MFDKLREVNIILHVYGAHIPIRRAQIHIRPKSCLHAPADQIYIYRLAITKDYTSVPQHILETLLYFLLGLWLGLSLQLFSP